VTQVSFAELQGDPVVQIVGLMLLWEAALLTASGRVFFLPNTMLASRTDPFLFAVPAGFETECLVESRRGSDSVWLLGTARSGGGIVCASDVLGRDVHFVAVGESCEAVFALADVRTSLQRRRSRSLACAHLVVCFFCYLFVNVCRASADCPFCPS
jgi:hypothetical protein